jgi:hypothetical protein
MGRSRALRPRHAFRALTRLAWEEAIVAKRQRVVAAACTRWPRSQSRRWVTDNPRVIDWRVRLIE